MNKTRLTNLLVILLVIMNGVLLYTVFNTQKSVEKTHTRPARMIIDQLDFNEEQEKRFMLLVVEHRQEMRRLNRQMQQVRQEYFETLKQDHTPKTKVEELSRKTGNLHRKINRTNYQHFRDIKNICEPGQLLKYNHLLNRMARHIGGPPPKRKPKR
jgi:periplasmic protein CpxP/Spy